MSEKPKFVQERIDIDLSTLPKILNLSAETITENVHKINSNCTNPRLKFVMERLVNHLHNFAREVHLQDAEWMAALDFIVRVGQISSPIRHEGILLSDVLGLSLLVDALSHPKPEGCTESTVLGPFETSDCEEKEVGDTIASEGKGEYMYVSGRLTNTKGEPVPNAAIEVWETDDKGLYDTQYSDRTKPDCRGIVHSDADGKYAFRAVVPVPYPIPGDGPVGDLLKLLGRHNYRPSHLHFKITPGGEYEQLITAIYRAGDQYETSDAVFGVKSSLIQEFPRSDDDAEARKLGFPNGGPFWKLERDFVLATTQEGVDLRKKLAAEKGVKGL